MFVCLSICRCVCVRACVCLYCCVYTPLSMWHFTSNILLTYILSLKSCVHCMVFFVVVVIFVQYTVHTHTFAIFKTIPLFEYEYIAINLTSHSFTQSLSHSHSISHLSIAIFRRFTHLSNSRHNNNFCCFRCCCCCFCCLGAFHNLPIRIILTQVYRVPRIYICENSARLLNSHTLFTKLTKTMPNRVDILTL